MRKPINPYQRPWTAEDDAELIRLRLVVGLKCSACARRLGRGFAATRKRLSKLGVVTNPERRHKHGRGVFAKKVRKMLRSGMGVVEIAETLGVSASNVSKVKKQLGYPPTPERERRLTAWRWRRLLGGAA